MTIVSIDDEYIDNLVEKFPHVYFSKKDCRTHARKYIGVVLTIGKFNYYVPFSSPKARDYTSDGLVRSDDNFNARMTESDGNGGKKLLGSLRFNNMIPVPMLYIEGYSIEDEEDADYANVVAGEFKWINKNQEYIKTKAQKIYDFKLNEPAFKNETNQKRYDAVLPFKEIEQYLIDSKMVN